MIRTIGCSSNSILRNTSSLCRIGRVRHYSDGRPRQKGPTIGGKVDSPIATAGILALAFFGYQGYKKCSKFYKDFKVRSSEGAFVQLLMDIGVDPSAQWLPFIFNVVEREVTNYQPLIKHMGGVEVVYGLETGIPDFQYKPNENVTEVDLTMGLKGIYGNTAQFNGTFRMESNVDGLILLRPVELSVDCNDGTAFYFEDEESIDMVIDSSVCYKALLERKTKKDAVLAKRKAKQRELKQFLEDEAARVEAEKQQQEQEQIETQTESSTQVKEKQ